MNKLEVLEAGDPLTCTHYWDMEAPFTCERSAKDLSACERRILGAKNADLVILERF